MHINYDYSTPYRDLAAVIKRLLLSPEITNCRILNGNYRLNIQYWNFSVL